jgi:tetratricopeptide (TPR) repeat protein
VVCQELSVPKLTPQCRFSVSDDAASGYKLEKAMPSGSLSVPMRVWVSVAIVVAFVIPAIRYGSASSRSQATHETKDAYSRRIDRKYDYRFGVNAPFLPSNATVDQGGFIPPGEFPTAAYCGHCHAAAYKQWQESAHRNSFRAPFYKKNVDLLIDNKGIAFSRHCEGCHNPIALLSGALTSESHVNRSFDEDGITCSVCHSITKLGPSYGLGSYVMGAPAVIVDEQGRPIPGTVPYSQILEHTDRHRQAVMRDIYKTPEFCGSCHKANLPTSLNGYRWLRAIGTYDEWQNSSLSKRSPLPFYQKKYTSCQDCHMPREAITGEDYGAKGGMLASHRWVGGNTAIPFYYGFTEQLHATETFLQKQQLGIDIFAIKPSANEPVAAPLGRVDFTVTSGTEIQAVVVIQNKGLGHSLIPEQRDFYEAWVEFTATDASGREIFHSGYLDSDGNLDRQAHSFTNRLLDKNGALLSRHEVWERRSIAYDKTIPPGRSTIVRFSFPIPEAAKGVLTLTARVNYRHFNQKYLGFVLGASHPAYPAIEMAKASRSIQVGPNYPDATCDSGPPEWMRWNNYGIALLDEGLYLEAANAFDHVVTLRPEYADAVTNVGLTKLRTEDYFAAGKAFNRALDLDPQNARAMFYRALAERGEGNLALAAGDLERVETGFPKSADVHRELGLTYFLLGWNQRAVSEYESAQSCDPDDLNAHYYLAVLYRRLGMRDKADQQAKLYADEKEDPSATTTALNFLHTDQALYRESLPSHIHAGVAQDASGPTKEQSQKTENIAAHPPAH